MSTSADLAAETVLPIYPHFLGIHGVPCSTCTNVMGTFTGAEHVAMTLRAQGAGTQQQQEVCFGARGGCQGGRPRRGPEETKHAVNLSQVAS